ncbi:MAG: hypothetical protein E6767_05295 [Dysgonomonas sp.]|nr:hypothetical protein [Dysgonomonas sp.]
MGEAININNGSNNVVNTGCIAGDYIGGNKNTIININIMESDKILEKLSETTEAINNLAKSQTLLAEAILKQRSIDEKHAEAMIILARATENNSIANVNMSRSLLDKDTITHIVSLIDSLKK